MPPAQRNAIADALRDVLISPNEADSNLEPANVVDALAGAGRSIARGLYALGIKDSKAPKGAIELLAESIKEASDNVESGLYRISYAIEALAEAVRQREAGSAP